MGASSPQYKAMNGCIRSFMLKHSGVIAIRLHYVPFYTSTIFVII